MSKINVNGTAVKITSELKLEDIKFLEKYDYDALAIFEGNEDDVVEVFRVLTSVEGDIASNGIAFGRANKKGYAELTIKVADKVEDVKKWSLDNLFKQVNCLNEIEANAKERIAELKKAFAEFEESIECDDEDAVKSVTKKVTKKSN